MRFTNLWGRAKGFYCGVGILMGIPKTTLQRHLQQFPVWNFIELNTKGGKNLREDFFKFLYTPPHLYLFSCLSLIQQHILAACLSKASICSHGKHISFFPPLIYYSLKSHLSKLLSYTNRYKWHKWVWEESTVDLNSAQLLGSARAKGCGCPTCQRTRVCCGGIDRYLFLKKWRAQIKLASKLKGRILWGAQRRGYPVQLWKEGEWREMLGFYLAKMIHKLRLEEG